VEGDPRDRREARGAHESLRIWVRRAEVDEGRRPGLTTDERARLKELERENRELRRANEILKSASVFFATELDGRTRK
jgi:transposase